MSSGFILTRSRGTGSPSSSTSFGTKTVDVVIPPGQTRDIDSTPFVTYAAAKWLITVVDDVDSQLQSYEIHGHFLTGQPTPIHSISSHMGDKIKNVVSLAVTASTLILRITNNEAYTIIVRSAKYDIAS